ncbi:hypothetical protein C8Q79DRAFT_1013454 [Trametes meyenii]|nr:hypothetical protein C8Q79DRAFT_1013454 [Trametes meyenii]
MATSSQPQMETNFSAEQYFATQSQPSSLEADVARVKEFLQRQLQDGRKVVLVTSGGTTVPLELNVVRFLDNFSAGMSSLRHLGTILTTRTPRSRYARGDLR